MLALENAALAFRDRCGLELVILRAGHLYGDGRMGFLQDFLAAMNGDETHRELIASSGDLRFQPIHVRAAVAASKRGDWIYHLGTNGCPTTADLVQELTRTARRKGLAIGGSELGTNPKPSSKAVHYPWPCHRAERELGYVAEWTLEGGFSDLLDTERTQTLMSELGVERAADLSLNPDEQQGDLVDREGRFWDEQEAAEALLYDQPHDWAFDPQLGNVIQAPVYRFMRKVFGDHPPKRVLDLGCGGGVYSRWMASGGVQTVGIDLSAAKIEKAKRLAEKDGVAHLCDFRVANAMDFQLEEPVDAICAFGVLHHFPDLEQHLPGILERNLKPGGVLIAIEPHCEDGFHPFFQRLLSFFGSTWLRRFFDGERYARIAEEARMGVSLRGESPAGLEVHDHDHVEIDELLLRDYEPQLVRLHHMLSPFIANAFVIYQRSRIVRGLVRFTMPLTVRLDGLLCRFKWFQDWAALGMYAVTRKNTKPGTD